MSFAKNVKHYQKYLLGTVVAVMALSLVVWGNQGADPRKTRVVAKFWNLDVTEEDYNEARAKALPYLRWKKLEEFSKGRDIGQVRKYIFKQGFLASPPQPKPEEISAAARELIILTFEAKHFKSIRVSEDEVKDFIQDIYADAPTPDRSIEAQQAFTYGNFACTPAVFKEMMKDVIVIRKSIELELGGANVDYRTLYQEYLAGSKTASAVVIGIDPDKLAGEPRPIGPEEVSAKYEIDGDKYKLPAKAVVEFLMADITELKKKSTEPTQEQIEKYYKDFKNQFVKPATTPAIPEGHSEEDGHDHGTPPAAQQDYKTLAEVREEIIGKIKGQEAGRVAYETMRKIKDTDVNAEIGKLEADAKKEDPAATSKVIRERILKKTEGIFGRIKADAAKRGVELTHDISGLFDQKKFDSVEAVIGKPKSSPVEWIFGNSEGEIALKLFETDKGYVLFRIAKIQPAYKSDLTEPIREKIEKELRVEEKKKRSERVGVEIEAELRAGGDVALSKIRARKQYSIQQTGYFTGEDRAALPLSPATMSSQVRSQVFPNDDPVEVNSVFKFQGEGAEATWMYVIYVQDVIATVPEIKESDFQSRVAEKEAEIRAQKMKNEIKRLVDGAEWQDVDGKAAAN